MCVVLHKLVPVLHLSLAVQQHADLEELLPGCPALGSVNVDGCLSHRQQLALLAKDQFFMEWLFFRLLSI